MTYLNPLTRGREIVKQLSKLKYLRIKKIAFDKQDFFDICLYLDDSFRQYYPEIKYGTTESNYQYGPILVYGIQILKIEDEVS